MYRSSNTLGHQEIGSHYPAAYRVVDIGADNQTRTAPDPRPQDLRNPSSTPAVTVRTNWSQAAAEPLGRNARHGFLTRGI